MSAFLCNEKLLRNLIAGLVAANIVKPENQRTALKLLLDANLKSLRARYGRKHGFHQLTSDREFVALSLANYQPVTSFVYLANDRASRQWLQVIQDIGCFIYQSCEFEGYEKAKIIKMLQELENFAAKAYIYNSGVLDSMQWDR